LFNYKKYEYEEYDGITYPYKKCNFFSLVNNDSDTYRYTKKLHVFINDIINNEIIKGTYESKLTSIQPVGTVDTYEVELYERKETDHDRYDDFVRRNLGGSYTSSTTFPQERTSIGIILPHLVITNKETILEREFSNHPYIEELTIANDVKKIGEEAFYNCPYLTKVNFKEGLNILMIVLLVMIV